MVIAVGGGWIALRLTGSLTWVFVALGTALVIYGAMLSSAIASGVWFRGHNRMTLRQDKDQRRLAAFRGPHGAESRAESSHRWDELRPATLENH